MGWYFVFFFISGCCSIIYELVWLRLTMAQFGVTTAQVSIVLSVFMGGLGLGSWAAGSLLRKYAERLLVPPLRLYALAELLIGLSALVVPVELLWGHGLVESIAGQSVLSSSTYYLVSGTAVLLILLPWCACMGATIPLAMFAIRKNPRFESSRSFSFLYLSNVIGAVAGAVATLVLVERHGFHGALHRGALLNAAIAVTAFGLSFLQGGHAISREPKESNAAQTAAGHPSRVLILLFMTGLATMGMEIVWVRLFTPYIGPLVYSFATILISYLVATFVGSAVYRDSDQSRDPEHQFAWISLALLGLLPLLTSDPRLPLSAVIRVILGVTPVSGVIGFLTPMLVDRWSKGDPDRASRAYAVNVLGCILGPLLAGFLLLPLLGERVSMLAFAAPWLVVTSLTQGKGAVRRPLRSSVYFIAGMVLAVFFSTKSYETLFPQREVLRDSTATVIATGSGMGKRLITNGMGMTTLTPVTKMMAHLTFASLDQPPRSALIICFGMGTTFRSAISWGIPVTAVELVPSVPKLFPYYHDDGVKLLASPLAHVVIDDGRRYLERSPETYDAIIIDPPPPVQAAGSSLLYSEEFYAAAKQRLRPMGILQQWLPNGDNELQSAVARALSHSFPYVRVYHSVEGWGWHFLASTHPIAVRGSAELTARMPPTALIDMMEWGPAKTADQQFDRMLATEMTTATMTALSPNTPALADDRPINEYYMLRVLAPRTHP